jgi:hypothetical protein
LHSALEVDPKVFNPQNALDPFDEKFNWKALKDAPKIENVEDSKEQDTYRLKNREKKE